MSANFPHYKLSYQWPENCQISQSRCADSDHAHVAWPRGRWWRCFGGDSGHCRCGVLWGALGNHREESAFAEGIDLTHTPLYLPPSFPTDDISPPPPFISISKQECTTLLSHIDSSWVYKSHNFYICTNLKTTSSCLHALSLLKLARFTHESGLVHCWSCISPVDAMRSLHQQTKRQAWRNPNQLVEHHLLKFQDKN